MSKLENYRIYMVFHLPSLKALDGVAVVNLYDASVCIVFLFISVYTFKCFKGTVHP